MSVLSCVCVPLGSLYYPQSFMDLIVVTQSFLVVDLGGKGLVDNPALCELLNRDIGVNL